MWTMRAFGANSLSLPVTRSSKRMPTPMIRSASMDGAVGVREAMHADHAQTEPMRLREPADAEQGQPDRDLRLLGQRRQFVHRLAR